MAAKVFVTVAEQHSLTQAADTLDMSTAMVSRYLASIETWLGVRLFHRTTRKISLTEAGQGALISCRQLLELADEMQHQAADRASIPSGSLRVATASSFGEAQLAAALIEFQQRYPQVSVNLLVADRALDLTTERIDLAVRITNQLEPSFITRQLAICRSVLCAAPAYLQQQGTPASLADLHRHQCLSHSLVQSAQHRFRQDDGLQELPVSPRFITNETAILRQAALAGGGIAILPTYYVADELRTGRLQRLLPELELETLGIHAVYLSRRHQPLALRLLLDFLSERFAGSLPPWDVQL